MKTLELNNLPTPVLLVWGLPEDACFITMAYPAKALYYSENDASEWARIAKGNWQLIGKLSELTEEQGGELVESRNYPIYSSGEGGMYPEFLYNEIVYTDYDGDVSEYKNSALESFHSAIESEGYHVVNPLGKEPELKYSDYSFGEEGASESLLESVHEDYEQELSKWREAQSKTLPANTLIFKRV